MFKAYMSKPRRAYMCRFTAEQKEALIAEMGEHVCQGVENGLPVLQFTTIHGDTAVARIGDWIVEEQLPGHYYPLSNVEFLRCYEERGRV